MKSFSLKLCLFLFLAATFSGRTNELGTLVGAITGTVLIWPVYRRMLSAVRIEHRGSPADEASAKPFPGMVRVPIGPHLTCELERYSYERNCRHHPLDRNAFFFTTRSGSLLHQLAVRKSFRRLCGLAGVHRYDGARYQPRIHDLRHSFVCHRLVAWYREGADVQRLLPQLSTYLGHLELSSTQRYLTMTPELLFEASRRFERYALDGASNE
jgi:hypothetical protein